MLTLASLSMAVITIDYGKESNKEKRGERPQS